MPRRLSADVSALLARVARPPALRGQRCAGEWRGDSSDHYTARLARRSAERWRDTARMETAYWLRLLPRRVRLRIPPREGRRARCSWAGTRPGRATPR